MRRSMVLAALVLLVSVVSSAFGATVRELELKAGTTHFVEVRGVQRVIVHDSNVVTAKTTGEENEVLVTAEKFGKSHLLCWDGEGERTKVLVTVAPRYWEALEQLLIDFPQIEMINTGEYIVLAGKVMKAEDMERISRATQLDPEHILNSVLINTRGLGEEISELLRRHGYEECQVSVVGKSVCLQGRMFDKHRREQLIKIVQSYVEPFGAKVDEAGLVVVESNLTVKVQFLKIFKSRIREQGLELERIVLGSSGVGGFASGVGPQWTGTVTGGIQGVINILKKNNAAKTEYETSFATKSGKEARLQEGGTKYVRVSTADEVGVTPIDYGFIVSTIPRLLDEDTIETEVHVEVKVPQPSAAGGDIDLSRFSTESNYSMTPGDTIVLSGLTGTVERMTKTGQSFISDIPIIGPIFGSKDERKEDTEVLLLITVNWKRPREAQRLLDERRNRRLDVPRP